MNRIEAVDKPHGNVSLPAPNEGGRTGTPADRQAWALTALILLAGIGVLTAVFHETAGTLVHAWDSAAYNHGYLIIPISLYVAWERQAQILPLRPQPTFWGLLPAIGFAACWTLGDVIDVNVAKEFGFIGLSQSLVFTILGWRASYALMFPILYTWLMLPFGDALYAPLQSIATQLTAFFLSLTSLPFFNEDSVIHVPSGTYRIAEVCAGLNFILASAALSLIYGTMMYRGWVKRVACVAIMLPLAVVSNGFRIFLIIYANHYLGANIDIVGDHYFYGWGFFGLIFLAMMWFGLIFRDPESSDHPSQELAARGPLLRHQTARIVTAGLAIVSIGIAAPAWSILRASPQSQAPMVALVLPILPEGQLVPVDVLDAPTWQPIFPNADATLLQRFSAGRPPASTVDLFIAYYATQTRDKEVVSYGNKLSNEKVWIPIGNESQTAPIDGQVRSMHEDRLLSGNETRLVWSFYWVGGYLTASKSIAKLLQAWNELSNGDKRAAFVAISTLEESDRDRSRQRLRDSMNVLPLTALLKDATPTQP